MPALRAFHVAEPALKNKGLLSASPSRVGDMENPTFFCFFFRAKLIARHPRTRFEAPSAIHTFSTSAKVAVAATADLQQQQQQRTYSSNSSTHLSAVVSVAPNPFDGKCTPNTEHLRDHKTASLGSPTWEASCPGIYVLVSHPAS